MTARPFIIARHFSAASRAAGGALLPEDGACAPLADVAVARGWLSQADRATLIEELQAACARKLIACDDAPPRPVAATLEHALRGEGADNRQIVVALPADERAERPALARQIDVIAARAALDGHLPPVIQLPIEHLDASTLASRRLQREMARVAAGFGQRHLIDALENIMESCDRSRVLGFDPLHHAPLARAVSAARGLGVPDAAIAAALALAQEGDETLGALTALLADDVDNDDMPLPPLVLDMPDSFVEASLTGHAFEQRDGRGNAAQASAAVELSRAVDALWFGAGAQFYFRDRAVASAPLAQAAGASDAMPVAAGAYGLPAHVKVVQGAINLLPFVRSSGIDVAGLVAATRLIALSLATRCNDGDAAALSLTNVAAAVMSAGMPYDSTAGRTLAAALAALVTATLSETMGHLAASTGMPGHAAGRDGFAKQLQAMRQRFAGAAFGASDMGRGGQAVSAVALHDAALKVAVLAALDSAADVVRRAGVAVLPVTMVATPSSLNAALNIRTPDIMAEPRLIDIAPEGDMPDEGFDDGDIVASLYRRALNPCVVSALSRLGYSAQQIDDIHFYVVGHGSLLDAPHINHASLKAAGCDAAAIMRIERALMLAGEISHAINVHVLGREWCVDALGIAEDALDDVDLIAALGFDTDEAEAAGFYACGAQSMAGAPHLDSAHLAVFDTDAGSTPVSAEARLMMQAALEPFLTGAVVQTVTCDPHISRDDLAALILAGWEAGVKNLALYRPGSGLDAPVALAVPDVEEIEFKEKNVKSARRGALTGS